jgi:pyrimidine operon attenuation protein/uracil phosphoribosyltransferase
MSIEILNHPQIAHRTRRIAYQIAEEFYEETQIIIAGIADGGYRFASLLKKELEKISEADVQICKVLIDKENPRNQITTSLNQSEYQNKGVVLCDDVLNSGTTLMYGVRHFLDVPLSRFKTAVLVNRNHKKYPVKADYKGLSLSTTLEEHIKVKLDESNFSVTLN